MQYMATHLLVISQENKIRNINSLTHIDEQNKVVLLTNDLKQDLIKIYDSNKFVVIPNFVFEEKLEYEKVKKDNNNQKTD